jgi:hypothetical protein
MGVQQTYLDAYTLISIFFVNTYTFAIVLIVCPSVSLCYLFRVPLYQADMIWVQSV